jgi:tetratricopeptide (TPR) repeat protein
MRIRHHAGRIAAAGGAVGLGGVLAVLAFAGYDWYRHGDERRATDLLAKVLAMDDEASELPALSAQESAKATARPSAASASESPALRFAARLEGRMALLETLAAKHPGTAAAKQGRLVHAATLYDAGRYDAAIAMYEAYAEREADPFLQALAWQGLGHACEAQALAQPPEQAGEQAKEAGLLRAKDAYQKLATSNPALALYHEARILQILDRGQEATELYKKVLDLGPEPAVRDDVRVHLAVLEQGAKARAKGREEGAP